MPKGMPSDLCGIATVHLPHAGFDLLRAEAAEEGFRFLDRLALEWESGAARFDRPGEVLLGLFAGGMLVGIGGIGRDPYASCDRVGRVRHVYVLAAFRGHGLGSALLSALLAKADGFFDDVRLRTDSRRAAGFYLRNGFVPIDDPSASHSRRRIA
jgi:GNAT superfamily N-acetyltransferase